MRHAVRHPRKQAIENGCADIATGNIPKTCEQDNIWQTSYDVKPAHRGSLLAIPILEWLNPIGGRIF